MERTDIGDNVSDPKDSMVSLREYVDTLFRGYKKAHEKEHELLNQSIILARDALDIRLEHMNEFRAQVLSDRGEFVNKDKFDLTHAALINRVSQLERDAAAFRGRMLGIGSAVTVMLIILQVVLRFM